MSGKGVSEPDSGSDTPFVLSRDRYPAEAAALAPWA